MRAKSLQPTIQLFVTVSVMALVLTTQQLASQTLGGIASSRSPKNSTSENASLLNVAASVPYTHMCSGPTGSLSLGDTWSDNSLKQYRMTWTGEGSEPWEYDSLNTNYFSQTSTREDSKFGDATATTTIQGTDPNRDDKVWGMLGGMFGYKPDKLKDAYVLKYTQEVIRDDPSPYKGEHPGIVVPSVAGSELCAPKTTYDIGPKNMEAMVVFATSDRVTLHIGRHEYMSSARTCGSQSQCSGGYWIYVSNINVDSALLSAYQSVQSAQWQAGADIVAQVIKLPMVEEGRRIGTAKGDGVRVVVRDDGPLIKLNQEFLWEGVQMRVFTSDVPTATPTPTKAVSGVSPTRIPQATPFVTPSKSMPTPTIDYRFVTPPATPKPKTVTATPKPTVVPSTMPTATPLPTNVPTRIPTQGTSPNITDKAEPPSIPRSNAYRISVSTEISDCEAFSEKLYCILHPLWFNSTVDFTIEYQTRSALADTMKVSITRKWSEIKANNMQFNVDFFSDIAFGSLESTKNSTSCPIVYVFSQNNQVSAKIRKLTMNIRDTLNQPLSLNLYDANQCQ